MNEVERLRMTIQDFLDSLFIIRCSRGNPYKRVIPANPVSSTGGNPEDKVIVIPEKDH
jgi:hypothetical protein